jgi:hypothetical protein
MSSDTSFRTGIRQALMSAINGIQVDALPDITEEGVEGAPRMIEFYAPDLHTGGLISFEIRDGVLRLQLYRIDPEVKVLVGKYEIGKAWSRVDEAGMIGLEARCPKCGEIYNPRSERMLNGDAVHLATMRGEACGGVGQVLGWWGRGPNGTGHEEGFPLGRKKGQPRLLSRYFIIGSEGRSGTRLADRPAPLSARGHLVQVKVAADGMKHSEYSGVLAPLTGYAGPVITGWRPEELPARASIHHVPGASPGAAE